MPALVLDERIYETSATTGTGEYTLAGAVTGFQPASVIGANNYCYYFATDDTNWESGVGTYVSGPDRLQRTHVLASSNGDAAVNWGAGTKKIRCGPLAAFGAPRQTSKSVAGSSDVTLTALEQRVDQLVLTGALTGNINVIVDTTKWRWTVYNNTSGAYTLTVKTSAGTGIEVPQGKRQELICDGVNVEHAFNALPDGSVTQDSLASGVGFLPSGAIIDFGGTSVPTGFLGCDGSNVSRTTYAALFSAIGTTWGVGDGVTTFTLPDFRRRTAIGSGGTSISGPGTSVGNTGGAETHSLTSSENGAHTHAAGGGASGFVVQQGGVGPNDYPAGGQLRVEANTASSGSGSAHNNMQPSAVVLKIIKT